MKTSLWCCRRLSAHWECISVMHACKDALCRLPTYFFTLYMHTHMSWYLTACECNSMCYVAYSIHVCYETEEVKREDGLGLTSTDLFVLLLR